MEPSFGRIEVRASPRSLSARKTHGHEHHQRKAPCLYLPNRQDTSRLGNLGNPQQTRNRLDTAPQSRLLIALTHPSAASEVLRRQPSVAYDTARGANSWEAQHQQRLMSRKFLPHSLVLRASWTIR